MLTPRWGLYLETLPESFLSVFDMDVLKLTDALGYYGWQVYVMVVLFGSMYVALLGASMPAKEEGEGTAEFLLTRPVSRAAVVAPKAIALCTLVTLFHIVVGLVTFGSFEIWAAGKYDPSILLSLILGGFLITLSFGGLGFLASAFLSRSRTALPIGLGGVPAAYFLSILATLTDSLEWVGYLTPFHYSDAGDVILAEGLNWANVAVLLGVAIIPTAISFGVYNRKDIAG